MANPKSGSARTGAELVVQTLEARGVEYVFGIPGAKIDTVFNALVDSSIRTVVCRHEQNAAFIAGGIGRLTGRAGIAIVPEGRRLLTDLTVEDNIRVASYALSREQASAGRDRVLELFP